MPNISKKGQQLMPASPIRKLVPYAEDAKKEASKYTISILDNPISRRLK
jgi:hypothetical protein